MDIRDYITDKSSAIDFDNEIMHICICGNNVMRAFVVFDDFDIAGWMTEGECIECGSRFKLPTPLDKD